MDTSIRRWTRSLAGFTWAGSLVVARGTAELATRWLPEHERERERERIDRLSWEAASQLDGAALELFQAADALQRDAADLLLPSSPWDPADWLRSAMESGAASGRTLRFAAPTAAGCDAWRELANKLEVYRLVKQVAAKIGVPPAGRPFPLEGLVERCYGLDDFAALWAVEGLGHAYALHFWPRGGPPPESLLSDDRAAGLPEGSLTMLHAGVGLAFAQRLLAELPPGEPAERTQATVAEILRLCRASSRPGYAGAALESLGLVTRTFHRDRVEAVDAALRRLGEDAARDFFWHGVGRALYFLPINFLPMGDTTWRPFEMGMAESPDGAARDNLLAGLGWAFTLVGMRQPELMSRLLLAPHGRRLEREPGFSNGVASSILMRTDTTPDSPLVETFLAYRPVTARRHWEDLVEAPSRRALETTYPRLRREGRLEAIFRFAADVGSVETGGAA